MSTKIFPPITLGEILYVLCRPLCWEHSTHFTGGDHPLTRFNNCHRALAHSLPPSSFSLSVTGTLTCLIAKAFFYFKHSTVQPSLQHLTLKFRCSSECVNFLSLYLSLSFVTLFSFYTFLSPSHSVPSPYDLVPPHHCSLSDTPPSPDAFIRCVCCWPIFQLDREGVNLCLLQDP